MKRQLLCAALCLFAAAVGFAQDPPERERQVFRALDFDGDGRVSPDEARWGHELIRSLAGEPAGAGGTARQRIPEVFRRLDRDRDGRLRSAELFGEEAPRGGGWMAMDRDGDGFISPSEFAAIRAN